MPKPTKGRLLDMYEAASNIDSMNRMAGRVEGGSNRVFEIAISWATDSLVGTE